MTGRGGAWVAGASVAAWAAYAWGAQCVLPALAWRRGPAGARQVALTFDDGPDEAATPRLLRLLAARDVRATFFLIGERAVRHPNLVRAISAAGHEVGNHTSRHRNAWFLPPGHRGARDHRGRAHRRGHPGPGAAAVPAALGHRQRRDAGDGTPARARHGALVHPARGPPPPGPAAQLRHVSDRLHDGAIVDLHDAPGLPGAPERLLAVMPGLLDLLDARGYAAVPVGELLAGPLRSR
jgi:peptidoglycan/xylan/chitin deacetylase (PgdA/CDA1 family)